MKKSLFKVLSFALFACVFLFTACEKESTEDVISQNDLHTQQETTSPTNVLEKSFIDYISYYEDLDDNDYFAIGIGIGPSIYLIKKDEPTTQSMLQLIIEAMGEKRPLKVTITSENEILSVEEISSEGIRNWKQNEGLHYNLLQTVDENQEVDSRSYSKYFSSYNQVLNLFNYLADQSCNNYYTPDVYPCITFQYKPDGCHARAHKMKQAMEQSFNKTCDKIFVYGLLDSGCGSNQLWRYHVAPLVYVGNTAYVLDPSIANEPKLVDEWKDLMTGGNYFICKTHIRPGYYYMPKKRYCSNNSYYADSPTLNHTNWTLLRYQYYNSCGN